MKKIKILVVEDEEIIALEIVTRLKNMGYDVCKTVASGFEAINELKQCKPDLILMDIRIKGEMDGIETAKKIAAITSTPIIYLTAYADKQTIERAKETTPFNYLVKPVQERDLRIAIEMAISKAKVDKKLKKERDLFSSGPVVVTIWSPEPGWPIRYVSNNIDSVLGYSSVEWTKNHFSYSSIIHPEDVEFVTREIGASISNGKDYYELSYRIRKKDNIYIWIYDYGKIERDEKGRAVEVQGYMFDQTQLKNATAELEESEIKYRTVANYTYN